MPPSEIADTWSADEIMDAAVLDEIEGTGQAKRLVARLCAEVHNAVRLAAWASTARKGDPSPTMLHESKFMPVRMRSKQSAEHEQVQRQRVNSELSRTLNAMCGF